MRARTPRQDARTLFTQVRRLWRPNGMRWRLACGGTLSCVIVMVAVGMAWAGMARQPSARATGRAASISQQFANGPLIALSFPALWWPGIDYDLLRPMQGLLASSPRTAAVGSSDRVEKTSARDHGPVLRPRFRMAPTEPPRIWRLAADLASGLIAPLGVHPADTTDVTFRVSLSSSGAEGNGDSFHPSISADGRVVAFLSSATNLVEKETRNIQVFVRDRNTDETTLVSVPTGGGQANGMCPWACISADGRYVAFDSLADNLVPGDTNGLDDPWKGKDVFVHDRVTGVTTRVSVSSTGGQGNEASGHPSISADGRYVAFASFADNLVPGDTNPLEDVFVHDCVTRETTLVSVPTGGSEPGDGISDEPSISADGRFVAFASWAELVPGNDYPWPRIFVHDRETGRTTPVSVVTGTTQEANDSCEDPCISADGRCVAFASDADNLVPGDTNGCRDIFVHDLLTGQTARVSVGPGGAQANGPSMHPCINKDGRYVAFWSEADNLVPQDTNGCWDVFVHDRLTGQTTRVSVSSIGAQGTVPHWWKGWVSISADGRYVAFDSIADNLVPADTNDVSDVFIRDRFCLVKPPGDMNQDGKVDEYDFAGMVAAWNDKHAKRHWNKAADLNGDNDLTYEDVQLYAQWLLRWLRARQWP
jgi:Tol biopolymer transport system component